MKTIQLITLEMENFKGCGHLRLHAERGYT